MDAVTAGLIAMGITQFGALLFQCKKNIRRSTCCGGEVVFRGNEEQEAAADAAEHESDPPPTTRPPSPPHAMLPPPTDIALEARLALLESHLSRLVQTAIPPTQTPRYTHFPTPSSTPPGTGRPPLWSAMSPANPTVLREVVINEVPEVVSHS